MRSRLREDLTIGEIVTLDKGYSTECQVEVVSQTPKKLLTRIRKGTTEWEVMTYRLTKIRNENIIKKLPG